MGLWTRRCTCVPRDTFQKGLLLIERKLSMQRLFTAPFPALTLALQTSLGAEGQDPWLL